MSNFWGKEYPLVVVKTTHGCLVLLPSPLPVTMSRGQPNSGQGTLEDTLDKNLWVRIRKDKFIFQCHLPSEQNQPLILYQHNIHTSAPL